MTIGKSNYKFDLLEERIMTIADGLIIAAVILGPILAVQAQRIIQTWKEGRERKLWIFKTLMATRRTPLSPRHVEGLNMIELEFSGKNPKEKAVVDAWKIYLDHLYDVPRNLQDPTRQSKLDVCSAKSNECLTDLLYTMSQALGYSFDKVQLKKGAYTPQSYVDLEYEYSLIRRGALEVLDGKRSLPVELAQSKKPRDS